MIIENGEKVHVAYRALYDNSTRRHFLGEVVACDGAVCRLRGYAFVFDAKAGTFLRKPELRETIINLSESGNVANVLGRDVDVTSVIYRYERGAGLVATDDKSFMLNINEFEVRS